MKEYLRGPGETITALTNGDVEDELLDLDFPHGIIQFPLGSLLFVNKNTKTELEKIRNWQRHTVEMSEIRREGDH